MASRLEYLRITLSIRPFVARGITICNDFSSCYLMIPETDVVVVPVDYVLTDLAPG
jgi:hypothetical protein